MSLPWLTEMLMVVVAEGDPLGGRRAASSGFRDGLGLLALAGARAAATPGPGRGGGGGGPATAAKNFTFHVLGHPSGIAVLRLLHGYRLQFSPRPASQDVPRTSSGPNEAGEFNPGLGADSLIWSDWVLQGV